MRRAAAGPIRHPSAAAAPEHRAPHSGRRSRPPSQWERSRQQAAGFWPLARKPQPLPVFLQGCGLIEIVEVRSPYVEVQTIEIPRDLGATFLDGDGVRKTDQRRPEAAHDLDRKAASRALCGSTRSLNMSRHMYGRGSRTGHLPKAAWHPESLGPRLPDHKATWIADSVSVPPPLWDWGYLGRTRRQMQR